MKYDMFLGGTLKIYGSDINPDVPYKTLLLSVTDNAAQVVRETLEKYGISKEDPFNFCLVQVLIYNVTISFCILLFRYQKTPRACIMYDHGLPLLL